MICTSPLRKSKYCIDEKYEWIERYIGKEFVERTIMTRDKTVVDGVYLLDDNHVITGSNPHPSWEHVIQTQPHNLHIMNRRRVDLSYELGYKWLYEELMYE